MNKKESNHSTQTPESTKDNDVTKYGFARPVAHKNIEGKELYYLLVWNDKGSYVYINIGKSTFEKCSGIVNNTQVIDTIDGV